MSRSWRLHMLCVVWLTALSGCAHATAVRSAGSQTGEYSMENAGLQRTFYLHVPPSYDSVRPMPLVLAFHGGSGSGRGMESLTGFSTLADQKGFLVVYPDGVDHRWR